MKDIKSNHHRILVGILSLLTVALMFAIVFVGNGSANNSDFNYKVGDTPTFSNNIDNFDDNAEDNFVDNFEGSSDLDLNSNSNNDEDDDRPADINFDIYDEEDATYFVTKHNDYRIFARSGPDKSYGVILTIDEGDTSVKLKYLEETSSTYDSEEGRSYDWYKIKTPSGEIGWIRSDVVTIR